MPSLDLRSVEIVWPAIEPFVFVPHTEQKYQRLVQILDKLTDTVGEDERHPLASLMEVIGVLIERYEDEHVPEITES